MIHQNRNWRYTDPVAEVSDGDEFIRCKFTQKSPHTEILHGKTGLVFHRCNLINCDLPEDSTFDLCVMMHRDHCYHLHPEIDLDVEVENCRHVIDVDEVIIDGQILHTEYTREDTVVE